MDWNYDTQYVALDTETTGLNIKRGDRPFALSLCDDQGNNLCWQWDVDPTTRQPHIPKRDKSSIRSYCKRKNLVFHNAQFDIQVCQSINLKLNWSGAYFDTSVMAHMVASDVHSKYRGKLKQLALHYFDIDDEDEKALQKAVVSARAIGKKLGWAIADKDNKLLKNHVATDYWLPRAVCLHTPELLPNLDQYNHPTDHPWFTVAEIYANRDTLRTSLLYIFLSRKIQEMGLEEILNREMCLNEIIYDMEAKGLSLFPKQIVHDIQRYDQQVVQAQSDMASIVSKDDFNPNSPTQMVKVLQELKFDLTKKTPTGGYSTDKHVFDDLQHQLDKPTKPKSLATKRKAFLSSKKKWSDGKSALTFAERYDLKRLSNIYPYSFNQVGTSTTRCSSDLHNVGKGKELDDHEKPEYNLRTMFGPSKGRRWFCQDYNQLQLRIFAHCAEERYLLDGFKQGLDAHTITACRIFGKDPEEITKLERRRAKNVNFGFIFGASPRKIELTAGMPGLWDLVTKLFPSAHKYMKAIKAQVYRNGYVTTPHGYRLYVDQPHKGVNYIVQGCEGDIVKQAMINCANYLLTLQEEEEFTGFLTFQIHDELIFDFPRQLGEYREHIYVSHLKKLMEQPAEEINMICPVDVEVTDTTWADARNYQLAV